MKHELIGLARYYDGALVIVKIALPAESFWLTDEMTSRAFEVFDGDAGIVLGYTSIDSLYYTNPQMFFRILLRGKVLRYYVNKIEHYAFELEVIKLLPEA